MNSLISIISPFKNEENYISDMIKSVINQSYSNWELILVDDHSEDDSVRIVETFSDHRVSLMTNKGNGIVDALTSGFEISKGEFITRMDADDLMPQDKLMNLISKHQYVTKRIVTGNVKYFCETSISEGYIEYEGWLNQVCNNHTFNENVYRECVIASSNWLALKVDLESINFPESLEYPEDYDLVLKWYQYGFDIVGMNKITHLWRDHSERISRNSKIYDQTSFFELKMKYWLELEYSMLKVVKLIGLNQKTKLIAKELIENNIHFEWYSNDDNHINQHVYDVVIEDFEKIQLNINDLIIIGVYPKAETRNRIKKYFEKAGKIEGREFWFF